MYNNFMVSTRDKNGRFIKGSKVPDDIRKKISNTLRNKPRKHDGYNNPAYGCWKNMLSRCRTKNKSSIYFNIKVCDRWLAKNDGFNNFIKDMGVRPSLKHSIDRINNDLGYYPENCRWATQSEQLLNRKPGIRFSEKARENIRKARIGNKNALGHKVSIESRKTISESLKKYHKEVR